MHIYTHKLITEWFQNKKFGTNLIKINFKEVTVSNILHSFMFLIKIWKPLSNKSKGRRVLKNSFDFQ